jgi:hypothetical protein
VYVNAWTVLKSEFFTSKQRKSSYKHMSGNKWFLSLIERLYSTINAITM